MKILQLPLIQGKSVQIAFPFVEEKIILTSLLTVSHLSPYFQTQNSSHSYHWEIDKPFEAVFSEDGSNQRCYEEVIYGAFSRYL